MTSNQQIPSSTPLKYAVESSSSYGSSSSNNLPLPSPSPKLSPGKSQQYVVALQCLKTATLDGVYYASSLHPHLSLSHGFPYISTRYPCLFYEGTNYLIELCLHSSGKLLSLHSSGYDGSALRQRTLKNSPSLVFL